MSRTYAKVKISIWGDSDFRELSEAAQALYFKLLTSPTLRLCGVADWRPKRMAALTKGQSVAEIEAAAQELQDNLYVIFDDDTEEALLRTFIRHDGVLKTPNVAASMVKDFAAVASAHLRGIIVHELHRLAASEPDHKGWTVVQEVLANPSIDPSGKVSPKVSTEVSPKVSVNPSPNVSGDLSGMDDPNVSGNDAHIPQPPTPNHQPSAVVPLTRPSPATKSRGTRIPDSFTLTDDMRDWAATEAPHCDVERETENFIDYWTAQSGAKAVKVDWLATWRKWMRKESDNTPTWKRKPQGTESDEEWRERQWRAPNPPPPGMFDLPPEEDYR